ncbi:hypothetical protein, conserved [Eimeria maxima]|uniref:Transmembrane protein n=1 Tax=Eimeria maxima TaxID=5804 RepID=U6MFA5_EIMMA|nr:hypothetical protein, conserved [Eimeria maxima]CDJ61733.1 hypothetical protein, conserved [Eimeria maxima]
MTAHELKQMPLHRFSSPLSPDQIAEVPLESVGGPRPYHMFVLFTFIGGRTDDIAQELSSKCRDCSAALAAFREVSRAYKLSDSSPGNEDVLPVFFAVVNIGTRDGAGISAIHPAMQVPIVMHLPPTAFRGFCSNRGSQDPRCSAAAAALSDARALSDNLSAVSHRIVTAEFFSGALNDGWDGGEDEKLQELFEQQTRDKIRGKFHFFSPSQSQLFLLQRFKNEAPAEQRLLEWANSRTKRNQWIVPAGGVVAYTLCSGGLIFSVIHSVPFAGYDEANRRYVLLAPTSRAQFMLEGLILASCSTVASLAALLLVRFPGSSEQVGRRPLACPDGDASIPDMRPGKSTEGILHSEGDARWQRLLAAASFAVTALIFVLCSGFVMQCYRTKAAWTKYPQEGASCG